MRTVVTLLLTLVMAVPAAAQAPADSGGDDAAIRSVVQQHDDARNRGDWKALGALFTEDAEQLTSAGEWRRGRAEIEKGIAQTMSTTYKGGKYVSKVATIRLLAPNVALADGSFEIANIGSGGSRRGHTTFVLVKSGSAWRIAASRSMVPTSVGATPPK
jgi:uncharacterized protein (TIGR02246 family)